MTALLVLLLLTTVPPTPQEHFPATIPTHVLLVRELITRNDVRTDGSPNVLSEPRPVGDAARLLLVLAGLEEGSLDPERVVPCDSRCWADGEHGANTLVSGFALSCDTWLLAARGEVGTTDISRHARAAGLPGVAEPEGAGPADEFPPAAWQVTVPEWADFWARLAEGRLELRLSTTSTLLAIGGTSVASPRGTARALHDPTFQVRAVTGAAEGGAWANGVLNRGGVARWSFSLWLEDGTPALAATRAADLLDETYRTVERSTRERGGDPLPPLDGTTR